MPLFNQLQGQQWSSLVWRLFGGAKVQQVSPELQVNVDLFARPELWALHGGNLLWGYVDGLAAGGAGTRSQIAIGNPANSRIITIVEHILFSTSSAEGLRVSLSQTDLTTSTGNLVMRDLRRATTAGASGPITSRIRTQNNAALANIASEVSRIFISTNVAWTLEVDAVLAPGWSIRVYPAADNTAINSSVTFFARERVVMLDELNGL